MVGDYRKGKIAGIYLVPVFSYYRTGVSVERYVQGTVGLFCDDVDSLFCDVCPLECSHIAVAESGEGTEAEEVASLDQGRTVLDNLLIYLSGKILKVDLRSVFRDIEVVEMEWFIPSKEYLSNSIEL